MRSLFICQIFCFCVLSVNNRYTEDTHKNALVPTKITQIILQLHTITPYLFVLVNGTAYSIVYLTL